MRLITVRRMAAAAVGLVLLAGVACTSSNAATSGSGACTPAKTPVITLAAYSTVYDTYGKLISAFQDQWKADHNGQALIFQTSFGGSTTQASWFWKSSDHGVQWHLIGCPLKSNCQNGGGDTEPKGRHGGSHQREQAPHRRPARRQPKDSRKSRLTSLW